MSDHGHESHWHAPSASHNSWPSVTKWAVGTMTGMFGFLFTGLFDDKGGWGWHGHH
jgi:hypothetical protein